LFSLCDDRRVGGRKDPVYHYHPSKNRRRSLHTQIHPFLGNGVLRRINRRDCRRVPLYATIQSGLFQNGRQYYIGLPVGHIFGRLGCFAAGCCYGKPYDGIFAVIYPKESLSAPAGIPLHPVQIYEAVYNVFVFIVLLILKRRSKEGKGLVLWTYLLLYGIGRFYMETLRYDAERGFLWIFSTSQWISIFSIITGITGMIFILSKKRAREESK
jgi:prolipoprotein diacylglyceryltransferase